MTDSSEPVAKQSEVMIRVLAGLGEKVLASHSQLGDDTITVAADQRLEVARWLQQDSELAFDLLMDSTVVDWDEREPRFEVVDHFFSTSSYHRLRVKCGVEEDVEVPSLAPLYGSAIWMERESWDMYGVSFSGHPDLRRILLYPEFKGHPLRKDYDKMAAQPLFEERYEGTRETSAVHHPAPRDLDGPTS